MNIGIMGAPVDNGNLGCMALTYSLLRQLEIASDEIGIAFQYYLFDGTNKQEKVEELAEILNIDADRIHCARPGFWVPNQPVKFAKSMVQNVKLLLGIVHCDCVIDITAGDSFTDIYGQSIFDQRTNAKLLLKKFGKPLMLAPQTYGPFLSKENATVAAAAINYADVVMSRDERSTEEVRRLTGKEAVLANDLAFQLPFERPKLACKTDKIKVGINVSGLLSSRKTERTETSFKLKADYDRFIKDLCEFFETNLQYEVYLISHVADDYEIHSDTKKHYPRMNLVDKFSNPIEAKSFISGMDIFIGARMHGTIGAFSSEIACIPIAYSRKFAGLFETIGYHRTVDLQNLDTQEATKTTIEYVKNYRLLTDEVKNCMNKVSERNKNFNVVLVKWLQSVNKQKNGRKNES